MNDALMLVAGVVAVGFLFVVVPVVFDVYHHYRHRKVITCPESHGLAEVILKTRLAALGAAFGKPKLRVKSCSLWPKRKGCREECVKDNWPAP